MNDIAKRAGLDEKNAAVVQGKRNGARISRYYRLHWLHPFIQEPPSGS